jgi:hypothetical protein
MRPSDRADGSILVCLSTSVTPDTQLDAHGKIRRVWLFEFRIHQEQQVLPLAHDSALAIEVLIASRKRTASGSDDDEVVDGSDRTHGESFEQIEAVRSRLLALEPRSFEFFIKDLLIHCGFSEVCITKFSADGGVDVSARASGRIWIFENMLVQVQAKRWLHSVGRKEVAELRGSLQPFAREVPSSPPVIFRRRPSAKRVRTGRIRLPLSTALGSLRS